MARVWLTILVVLLAVAVCVGVAVTVLWYSGKLRLQEAQAERPEQKDLPNYGHPASPTKELRKRLPHPPTGCQWETKVTVGQNGHYLLGLCLVDVATATSVAATTADLTRDKRLGQSWASTYRKYPSIGTENFYNHLIGPLVDWAVQTVTAHRAGEVYDYQIGEDR